MPVHKHAYMCAHVCVGASVRTGACVCVAVHVCVRSCALMCVYVERGFNCGVSLADVSVLGAVTAITAQGF